MGKESLNPVDAEIRVDRMGDAAPAMPCRDQHLLVPKTEEKRCAPWLDLAGDAPGDGGALRGGGAGSGAARAGRS